MALALASAGAEVAVHDREQPCATEKLLRDRGCQRTTCLAADLAERGTGAGPAIA
jgi:hypothetical protein